MNIVELYELALSGIAIQEDFWPAEAFEQAHVYKMGEHLKLPAALIRKGDALVDSGTFRLSSEYVIFVYDTPEQHFKTMALLCMQIEPANEIPGLIMSSPLVRIDGKWTEFFAANMWSFSGERKQHIADYMRGDENKIWLGSVMSMAYALTVGGVASLEPGAAIIRGISSIETQIDPFLTVSDVSFLN